jgi:hypothetical protein
VTPRPKSLRLSPWLQPLFFISENSRGLKP